jgi:hypothetical protein
MEFLEKVILASGQSVINLLQGKVWSTEEEIYHQPK